MIIDPGCTLARPAGPGTCDWDGKPLQGRQRRWCSRACADAAFDNHSWTYAREAALRRDQRTCQRCGYHPPPEPRMSEFPARLYEDPVAAYWAVHNAWCRHVRPMEVNHKTPILGLHNQSGCHHHLDGLEVLCRPCHLDETARQRQERADTLAEVRRRSRGGDEDGARQLAFSLFEEAR